MLVAVTTAHVVWVVLGAVNFPPGETFPSVTDQVTPGEGGIPSGRTTGPVTAGTANFPSGETLAPGTDPVTIGSAFSSSAWNCWLSPARISVICGTTLISI